MKILSMTATFGCLDHATLTLDGGLNILSQPNESGKSTWAAFLQAMFYGIDTSRRAAKGSLPDKTRYQPWNGKAMEGTVELEHEGRRIILQRTSQRGRPMGAFRAYDADTGLELPELTGENCGMYFFGVEREVFRRSAFLSGGDLAVTESQELAKRLENLAVSGSVEDSFPAADARLKQWKTRHRYHQNGMIPDGEAALRRAEDRLERAAELRRMVMEADSAYKTCRNEAEAMEDLEKRRWEAKKEASQIALLQATERMEQADRIWAETGLPYGTLCQLRDNLSYLEKSPMPPGEVCPPALQGLKPEEISAKVGRDQTTYHRLLKQETRGNLWLRLALGCVLLAAAATVGKIWWAVALCLCGAGAGWMLWSKIRKNRRLAKEILRSYGVEDVRFLGDVEKTYTNRLQAQTRYRNAIGYRDVLLEELQAADDTIAAEEVTLPWVEQQIRNKDRELEAARQSLQEAKSGFVPEDAPFTPSAELIRLRERAAYLQAQAKSLQMQEETAVSLEAAAYQKEQRQAALEQLYRQEQALGLAREALEAAHSRLEQVYAPQLTGAAGEYLKTLTTDRYSGLVLGKDWQLQVRETSSGLARPRLTLSSGTRDLVWLSLRLAMAKLLLPDHAPLVLDDALLTFDRVRRTTALEALRQEPRQVILFSCQEL